MNQPKTETTSIMQYESRIWATADLLRGCGIKESEWPSYMMPFINLDKELRELEDGLVL